MSGELALTHKSVPVPREFSAEEVQLIKDTVARGTTDAELQLFIYQCKRTGLDPFSRQIHAVKRKDKQLGHEVMTIQVGIDGYRLIADRTGKYAGSDDPVFEGEEEGHPLKATATVWKLVGGQRCPFAATARWSEYAQTKYSGELNVFWRTKPYLMLAKCAEGLALRKAFPQELSGIYTPQEIGTEEIEAEVIEGPPPKQLPPKAEAAKPGNGHGKKAQPPATSEELDARVRQLDAWFTRYGYADPEEFYGVLVQEGLMNGYPDTLKGWPEDNLEAAWELVMATREMFLKRKPAPAGKAS